MARRPRTPVPLRVPGPGRWLVQNSPADRMPSHGTRLYALEQSIDLTPVGADGRSGAYTLRSFLRPEAPEHFVGFGREIRAPIDGTVRAAHDGEPDHAAHRGLPSVGYMLTQRRRAAEGWTGLAGNHVIIEADAGVAGPAVFLALCHLRQGSLMVRPGQQVHRGKVLAQCGNSGNSTEPHVHLQAMDDADPTRARALPITFPGGLPRNGSVIEGE
ncbi:M23 family metallopeptidase [Brachybacterium sp. p3-SID957]|uniref:M23 family metallopeptidase n=1 Tax=Brachybacterium sp. p3-SID957 TaxID=2916049 RepID=UPI00223AAE5C|nr:M23 family metallopeptidase [Brachybacterium sp. p3-SID957]MCT1774787.1 M23 family metallopeptidase [Brachybacterium sp. p3-SID957]